MTRTTKITLAAAAIGALIAGLLIFWVTRPQVSTVPIGGAFDLVDQDGRAVTQKDLLGKPTAIFFGFTYCPEVCPTTLTDMTAWLNQGRRRGPGRGRVAGQRHDRDRQRLFLHTARRR